jgi:hypothetical protein
MKKFELRLQLKYPGLEGGKGSIFTQNSNSTGYYADASGFNVSSTATNGQVFLSNNVVENNPDYFEDQTEADSPFRTAITGILGLADTDAITATEAVQMTLKKVSEYYPDCGIEPV